MQVDGFGDVWIRSNSELRQSQRYASYLDSEGKVIPAENAKASIHIIIDQICDEDGKPLFTDGDFAELAESDSNALEPLQSAIRSFNGDQKKRDSESVDTSKS